MSDSTFNLIKSLSNREKAYFRKQSNIHNEKQDKNYLKLYDFLENSSIYDKEKIKNEFSNTKIEKYLSSELNYLKNRILRSLFNFHLGNSSENETKEGIILVEMLLKKGLKKEALKKLNFVKKNAYKREEFTLLLQLIELEEKIQFREGSYGFLFFLKTNESERNIITNAIENLNEIRILRAELRQLQFSDHFFDNGLDSILGSHKIKILKNKNYSLSKKAKDHWYYTRTMSYYLVRDFNNALQNAQKHLDFLQENEHLFPKEEWLSKVSNFLYMAALLGDKKNYNYGIDLISSLQEEMSLNNYYISYIICSRSLCFAYHSGNLELSKEWLSKSLSCTKNSNKITQLQHSVILMEIVRCCISLNNYEIGAQMINQLWQIGIYQSGTLIARIYTLMIHYKLSWFQLLESGVMALQKLKKEFPREDHLITYFHAFFKNVAHQGFAKKSQIQNLQYNLLKLSEDPEKNFTFQEFNFYAWSMTL